MFFCLILSITEMNFQGLQSLMLSIEMQASDFCPAAYVFKNGNGVISYISNVYDNDVIS